MCHKSKCLQLFANYELEDLVPKGVPKYEIPTVYSNYLKSREHGTVKKGKRGGSSLKHENHKIPQDCRSRSSRETLFTSQMSQVLPSMVSLYLVLL